MRLGIHSLNFCSSLAKPTVCVHYAHFIPSLAFAMLTLCEYGYASTNPNEVRLGIHNSANAISFLERRC